MFLSPRRATLFPYTTLFRSLRALGTQRLELVRKALTRAGGVDAARLTGTVPRSPLIRSEEHTSELQSRFDLVCRLLLEKKNAMTCTGPDFVPSTCVPIVRAT